jgi:hypothetical protein
MKRIFLFAAVAFLAVTSFSSCELLGYLADYEEEISFAEGEWEENVPGKWILKDVGFNTYLDEKYDVERIDKEGYPAAVSSIESIEILSSSDAVINFKKEVPFEVTIVGEGRSIIRNYRKFDSRTEHGLLYLGFDSEGHERFSLYETPDGTSFEAGIFNWNIKVYGTETLSEEFKLSRMIIEAGIDVERAYYELVPAK